MLRRNKKQVIHAHLNGNNILRHHRLINQAKEGITLAEASLRVSKRKLTSEILSLAN